MGCILVPFFRYNMVAWETDCPHAQLFSDRKSYVEGRERDVGLKAVRLNSKLLVSRG